jgi:hypothetical protein
LIETGEKIYNLELHDLYSSLNIIRMIKSRRRCVGNVARMGKDKFLQGFGASLKG